MMTTSEGTMIDELELHPLFGGDPQFKSGYHTEGDLVTVTADGIDLNALWAEFQATAAIYSEHQSGLVQLLTFPVTNMIETVPQVGEATFEEASEFGEPRGARVTLDYFQLGYDFRDYDVATRYTWKFLRDADARQIQAVHEEILRADERLIFRKVMEAIFDNRGRTTDIRNQAYNVYPLYNNDGTVPPAYKDQTFDGTHDHYLVSGANILDPDDVEDAYEHIAEHGYSIENGTTFVMLTNKAVIKEMRKWRQGDKTTTGNGNVAPSYDFVPSANQPSLIVPNEAGLLGSQPPSQWNGLAVAGSYGDILVIEESYIPDGYFLMFGSGGAGDLQNLVGLREHANPAYRGLRLLPGNQQRYPLVDSYYSRGFGTGIRQRGGAVIMQITSNPTYTIPNQYKRGTGLI